jgi:hypothetical protein
MRSNGRKQATHIRSRFSESEPTEMGLNSVPEPASICGAFRRYADEGMVETYRDNIAHVASYNSTYVG